MLVDIPIGLCNDGKRACDVNAKAFLEGQHQRSVFYTPIRKAVYARNLESAKEEHENAGVDFGIQTQAWSIVPRIREAEAFVAECEDGEKIRETHSEACFVGLNGGALTISKKTDDGIKERLSPLQDEVDFDVDEFLDAARRGLDRYRSPDSVTSCIGP